MKTRWLVLFLLVSSCREAPPSDYVREVEAWRQARVDRLRAPDGWLTLVGLAWVDAGDHRVGSGADCDVRLPDSAPAFVGTLRVEGPGASLEVAPGVTLVRDDGTAFTGGHLDDDAHGPPTIVRVGSVRFYVIARSGRLAVRIKDSDSPVRAHFAGLDYFPIETRWRVVARFFPYAEPKSVAVPTVLGHASQEPSPGELELTVEGHAYRLQVLEGDEGGLFLVFGDATNGTSTYGAGRFVDTEAPRADGTVVVDFNRAYNPPCAFTPYATCPVPTAKNRLPVAVSAGERKAGHS